MLRIFSKFGFSTQNFYQLLGVQRNATSDEIKKQFHILAKKYHPDSPHAKESDQEMFKTIVAAYNTLSDENERIKYDRTLNEQQQQQQQSSQNYQYTQYQKQQQQQQQRPINPNAQFFYDFRRRTQDFEERDFQRQREKQQFIEDNPLFHSMRKSPELYVVSLVLFVIMWRWFSIMNEERSQSRYQSFPEDPEFIREKERDYKKRYGHSPYPDRQILYKVTKTECKNIPIDILESMEDSGRYLFDPLCYERIDKHRSEYGAQVIQVDKNSDDPVNEYLKLSKKKKIKKQQIVDDDDEENENENQVDPSQMYKQARVFRKIKGLDANHLNQENIQQLQKQP